MCKAIQEMYDDGVRDGIKQGIQKGVEQGRVVKGTDSKQVTEEKNF